MNLEVSLLVMRAKRLEIGLGVISPLVFLIENKRGGKQQALAEDQ